MRLGVDRRPRTTLGLSFPDAAIFVTFLDVLSLALLLICVRALVASWHWPSLLIIENSACITGQAAFARCVPIARSTVEFSTPTLTVPSTVVIVSRGGGRGRSLFGQNCVATDVEDFTE
jgi:hypothetical protein